MFKNQETFNESIWKNMVANNTIILGNLTELEKEETQHIFEYSKQLIFSQFKEKTLSHYAKTTSIGYRVFRGKINCRFIIDINIHNRDTTVTRLLKNIRF